MPELPGCDCDATADTAREPLSFVLEDDDITCHFHYDVILNAAREAVAAPVSIPDIWLRFGIPLKYWDVLSFRLWLDESDSIPFEDKTRMSMYRFMAMALANEKNKEARENG